MKVVVDAEYQHEFCCEGNESWYFSFHNTDKRLIFLHFCTMRTYPSKLLLFGEHVLLLGASALAIPLHRFSASWQPEGKPLPANILAKLRIFANSTYLSNVSHLDAALFASELENGLSLQSDIPVGYGLGSSGALCAAVYDRYCSEKTDDLSALKSVFSNMESFFHGSSSGIDPLTSYLNQPLLIRNKSDVFVAGQSAWSDKPYMFLLDTGLPRQTGLLVNWFLEQSRPGGLLESVLENYIQAHEQTVRAWLSAEYQLFFENLNAVSRLQLEYFTPMVPANMRELWEAGLDSGKYTLKICGAGGGGFMLGFCKNPDDIAGLNDRFPLITNL